MAEGQINSMHANRVQQNRPHDETLFLPLLAITLQCKMTSIISERYITRSLLSIDMVSMHNALKVVFNEIEKE
jgi:hypothetical protein